MVSENHSYVHLDDEFVDSPRMEIEAKTSHQLCVMALDLCQVKRITFHRPSCSVHKPGYCVAEFHRTYGLDLSSFCRNRPPIEC